MKECIYSIPITDALKKDSECPFCELKNQFEYDLVYFYLGPSVMDDQNRAITDAHGFCSFHYSMLYKGQKMLPLALMLQSHLKTIIKELEGNSKTYLGTQPSAGLISKLFSGKGNTAQGENAASKGHSHLHEIEEDCIICSSLTEKMNLVYDNFFYLYKAEKEFEELFNSCKGVCLPHFLELHDLSSKFLSNDINSKFTNKLYNMTLSNLNRVLGDLDWFIQKFDYRFTDEPWKNSKDAVPRTIQKLAGKLTSYEEMKNKEKQY